ncbi:MAG: hypothetical protein V3T70_00485, partial [Phycisphaerae bacterium]
MGRREYEADNARVIFAIAEQRQIRFIASLANRLRLRGVDCYFAVCRAECAPALRPIWGDRVFEWKPSFESRSSTPAMSAQAFWSRLDVRDAMLIAWNETPDSFIEAGIKHMRSIGRPVVTLGELTVGRDRHFLVIDRSGLYPTGTPVSTDRSQSPLWPVEQARLDALRERLCRGVRPRTSRRPYACLLMQSDDDARLI